MQVSEPFHDFWAEVVLKNAGKIGRVGLKPAVLVGVFRIRCLFRRVGFSEISPPYSTDGLRFCPLVCVMIACVEWNEALENGVFFHSTVFCSFKQKKVPLRSMRESLADRHCPRVGDCRSAPFFPKTAGSNLFWSKSCRGISLKM